MGVLSRLEPPRQEVKSFLMKLPAYERLRLSAPEKPLAVLGMFGGIALAAFGANLVRSPRWARERKRQMEAIAEHVVKLLSRP